MVPPRGVAIGPGVAWRRGRGGGTRLGVGPARRRATGGLVGGPALVRRAGGPTGGGLWPLLRFPAAAAAVRELSTPATRLASPSTRDWRSERARWSRRCCPWFLRYCSPQPPCARPAMAAAALPRPGMAGREAALSRIPRARRRRDSRGGPGRGGYSWARSEVSEPSRCVVWPRRPDSPGAAVSVV